MALRGAAGGAGSGAAAADSGAASGPRNFSKGAPRGPDAARCGSARRLRSSEAGRSPAGEKCVDGHERLEMRHDQHLSSGGGAWCSQRRGGKPQGESRARWPMSLGARCGQRGAVPQRSREPASPCPQTPWARGQTRAWGMGWRVSHAPERSAPLRCVRRGRDARPICTGVRDAACPLSTRGGGENRRGLRLDFENDGLQPHRLRRRAPLRTKPLADARACYSGGPRWRWGGGGLRRTRSLKLSPPRKRKVSGSFCSAANVSGMFSSMSLAAARAEQAG